MRKFITILITLLLLASFVSCSGEQKKLYEQGTFSSNSTSDKSSTPVGTNSNSEKAPSSNSDSPSKSDSSSNKQTSSTSKPNPSSNNQTSSTSKPNSTTVNKEFSNYTICYNDGDYNVIMTTFDTEYWKMPFAIEDDGTFTRDGYVLLGYSFDKNGKGELIRPGYKYIIPTNSDVMDLYCVWAKETNSSSFKTTQKNSGEVYITAYNGSDKVVYIPRKIGGKAVSGISAGAFKGNKAISEVHITSSVLEVEANAFASCSNLKTVTVYDNLKTISDASFAGSPVKTVRICAGKTPRYTTSYSYGIKYERMIKTKGENRIIVVAGSSALYGIESNIMEEQFENDYTVVNFGTNGNMNIPFYLDAITPLLTKKDIVVFAPEQYGPYAYHTNGNKELPMATFQGISSCYNLFENIDASTYTKVFDSFGQYCVQTSKMKSLSWQDYDHDQDQYGNHALIPSKMNSPTFRYGANGWFRFNETVIPSEYIPNLNRIINRAANTGAKILFSYPPHNKNNIEQSSLNDKAYNAYNAWIAKTVNCKLISDVRNYIYKGEYFANTDYHLNTIGRELHTRQLAKDLINANIGVK